MIQPAQPGLVWSSRAGKAGSAAARSIWQELYLQSQTWWRNVLILSGLAVGRTNHNAGVPLSTAGVFHLAGARPAQALGRGAGRTFLRRRRVYEFLWRHRPGGLLSRPRLGVLDHPAGEAHRRARDRNT